MAWSKIKTIIIVILAALNVCLAALIASQQVRSVRIADETLARTVEVLALNGIEVEEMHPADLSELNFCTLSRDVEREWETAQQLLGSSIIINAGASSTLYTSAKGSLTFQNGGALSGTLALPVGDHPSMESHAAALLEQLGVEVWSLRTEEGSVTAVPAVEGTPLFDGAIVLTYENNMLTEVKGRIPGPIYSQQEDNELVSAPTALIALLEYVLDSGTVCRAVRSMTPGYLVASAYTDSVRLAPCWLVETDTVDFYIDGATGAVSRVE